MREERVAARVFCRVGRVVQVAVTAGLVPADAGARRRRREPVSPVSRIPLIRVT